MKPSTPKFEMLASRELIVTPQLDCFFPRDTARILPPGFRRLRALGGMDCIANFKTFSGKNGQNGDVECCC